MSLVERLDPTTLEKLTDIVGGGILSTISILNTKYVGGVEEFSGTGLLVSDGAKKYVFTANHVLDPSKRVPPRSGEVELNYHSFGLQKGGSPNRPYALRRKYWCSEKQDLALIESAVSERLDIDPKTDYYPIDTLTKPVTFDPYLEDLFVVCGFPAQKRLRIPVVAEIKHGMLVHYFAGHHGREDPAVNTRFRIKFDGRNVSPTGISGSPVWLIRNMDEINSPLTIEHLSRLSGKGCQFVAQVIGVVVEYFEESGEISAVKSDVCAEFVKQAQQAQTVIPTLRNPNEDEWIDQQLRKV